MRTEKFLGIKTCVELQQLSSYPGIDRLTDQQMELQPPDAHWILLRQADPNSNQWFLVGRCSLWWKKVPAYGGERVGLVGHYAVEDAAAGDRLLNQACQQLTEQGCTLAIAPIDGNTGQNYRFVVDAAMDHQPLQPPFFLEPNHPQDWVNHLLTAGFTPLTTYYSGINSNLSYLDPAVACIQQRLTQRGIHIRPARLDNLEAILTEIYEVAIRSFRRNFLYSQPSSSGFVDQYRALLPYIKPEFVLLAKQSNRLVGFLLAMPDWLQAQRGETIYTIIIKTVAVLPERAYAGLGHWLVAHCQQLAHQLGYQRAIHALMHEANPSRNLSDRYAQPFRRYALFSKPL